MLQESGVDDASAILERLLFPFPKTLVTQNHDECELP